ncbi:MAG: hypothetical protein HS126_19400 [Anaerolineales bacterium]|nr:hypothetical protein [Anaerolineales bacterium]
MKKMQNVLIAVSLSLVILVIVWDFLPSDLVRVTSAQPLNISEYESRKALLPVRATKPFSDDPLRNISTTLDLRSFDQINKLNCPKPINKSEGWSVEFRTGGRPFMNFDTIQIRDKLWSLVRCTPGSSGILQSELDSHYDQAGKKVNRLWFIHKATEGSYPTVVVMTSDGFFNVAGAESPKLQGAATRTGFIGEPFSLEKDYLQHVDNVNITEVDTYTIRVIYDIHSEAGEGILEVELKWITATLQPELHFRSAHVSRLTTSTRLGFAGFNFMRGPTLWGLPHRTCSNADGEFAAGIEAFHDGRSIFLIDKNGIAIRNLLIPPITTGITITEDISTNVSTGSKLVIDQPQNVNEYFSKCPIPGYEQRTDLTLKFESSTIGEVSVRRAQIAVDLADLNKNPEANETVNAFYAVNMAQQQLYEFSFTLEPTAFAFEEFYQARQEGLIFVSDRSGGSGRLYFLPLNDNFLPTGPAEPLTDGVIKDPHRPSISPSKRFVIFDADDYKKSSRQRLYTLDLATAAVRRLTFDTYINENSNDWGGSFSTNSSQFTTITDRQGSSRLTIENLNNGLEFGFGNSITDATSADWNRAQNEIVFANNYGLWIYDQDTGNSIPVIFGSDIRNPKFSPCFISQPQKIAYVKTSGIYIINHDGSGNRQVLHDGDYPAWVDDTRLIIQRTVSGNTDLYLLDTNTSEIVRLTTEPGIDAEPTFIRGFCVYLPILRKSS